MDEHGNRWQKYQSILRNVTMIGQLGLSLIMPVLLCMFGCYFLTVRLQIGSWIYIPGLVLGIGASATTAWKTYRMIISREKKKEDDRGPSFNRHL